MGGYKVCIGLVLCVGPRQSLVESTLTLYRVGLSAICFHTKMKKNCYRLGSVVVVSCHKVLIIKYTSKPDKKGQACRILYICDQGYEMNILWNSTLQSGVCLCKIELSLKKSITISEDYIRILLLLTNIRKKEVAWSILLFLIALSSD